MHYSSNIHTVVLNLQGKLKKAADVSGLQREVATYMRASNLRRIHNDGMAVNGTSIGAYSTKPIYVSPKRSPKKFTPKGKAGKTRFKNGKFHRSGYFGQGYKGFRAAIGRATSPVNLQLSGKLLKSWGIQQQGKDWVIGFTDEYGKLVSRGNERHFRKMIWGVTAKDKEQIRIIEEQFIKKALNA